MHARTVPRTGTDTKNKHNAFTAINLHHKQRGMPETFRCRMYVQQAKHILSSQAAF
jgi:hypothetical protein